MPNKSNRAFPISYPNIQEAQESPKFPSARYFQVHFEYLESQLTDTRRTMEKLEEQIAAMTTQLAALNVMINESNKLK